MFAHDTLKSVFRSSSDLKDNRENPKNATCEKVQNYIHHAHAELFFLALIFGLSWEDLAWSRKIYLDYVITQIDSKAHPLQKKANIQQYVLKVNILKPMLWYFL